MKKTIAFDRAFFLPTYTPAVYRLFGRGGCYVGASENVRDRVMGHAARLRRGVHSNAKLQSAFDRGLLTRCEFQTCEIGELAELEFEWHRHFAPSLSLIGPAIRQAGCA